MTSGEPHRPSSQALLSALQIWYQENGRHSLPWRQAPQSAYRVWVSEIMLQQTQVSRVISYYTRFLERFPSVHDLAQSEWESFLPFYAGLGYYQRGRNMLKTAQHIVSEFGGKFPQTYADLRTLPGVGDYTARAILSFAFQQPFLAIDTNLKRVFGRYFLGQKSAEIDLTQLEKELGSQAPWLNAAIMDFANAVCTKTPQCSICPLRLRCHYAQTNGALETTTTKTKSTFPKREADTMLVLHQNHRQYYSSKEGKYQPFFLPHPLNTRARIKAYFERVYQLQLSVRPPHLFGWHNGKPTQLVNAQILSGTPQFSTFPKEVAQAALQAIPLQDSPDKAI